jgi:hypothetical protein
MHLTAAWFCAVSGEMRERVFSTNPWYLQSLTGTSPSPPGNLPVVPLIAYQRYYGEVTVRFPGGPREGLVQGWRNRGQKLGGLGR